MIPDEPSGFNADRLDFPKDDLNSRTPNDLRPIDPSGDQGLKAA